LCVLVHQPLDGLGRLVIATVGMGGCHELVDGQRFAVGPGQYSQERTVEPVVGRIKTPGDIRRHITGRTFHLFYNIPD